jgi:hypothetical protein
MSDTEKQPEKQPEKQRIPIAISSQQMEDRYRVEASRAKAQKMGASSRILRLFENDAS